MLSYTAVDSFLPLAMENFPTHSARAREFAARGVLLMIDVLDEPMNGDAIAVFTSREAAEEFVSGDPFVVNGVVAEWSVRPWNEALTG